MKSLKYTFYILAISILIISCKSDPKVEELPVPQKFMGTAIGTSFTIQLFSDDNITIEKEVDSIIDMFNNSMSTWVPNSVINQFNNGADSVLVGMPFKEVYDQAVIVHNTTNGYLDPTVGNLVNAYGFGADGEKDIIPSEKKLDSLRSFVGFHKIQLLASHRKDSFYLASTTPGVYLEFNAIGKGTLVDHIARLLDKKGVKNYLVEVGGEVVASGKNLRRNNSWAVGIDDPNQKPNDRTYVTVVNLDDKAMAGSGNYRKNKVDPESGLTYVHTVNPITGRAQPSQVLGVNVIAKNCTLADGYATAFMAMPLEMSVELIHTIKDIDVLIMYIDDKGLLRFEMTPGFKSSIKASASPPQV
jgi:thiamine biosynthesis lipoprotein